MRLARLAFVVFAIVIISNGVLLAQTAPNLENGWKPFGSYDGTHLDTVNLLNGNLMLHAPIVPDVPQRGSLKISYSLYGTSKDWQVSCFFNSQTQLMQCSWVKGGGKIGVVMSPANLSVHRTLDKQYSGGEGNTTYAAYGYTITTSDGATHQLHGVTGTEDLNGEPTQFDSADLSGYHLVLSGPDSVFPGVLNQVTVMDRAGNQYQGNFFAASGCGRFSFAGASAPGASRQPVFDDAPAGDQFCSQVAFTSLVTDSNGNQISPTAPPNFNPAMDTLGKAPHLTTAGTSTTDYSGCVSTHSFSTAGILYYQDPNGVTRQIKTCSAEIPIQTAFNQPNPYRTNVMVGEGVTGGSVHFVPVVSIVLADGTRWTFDYDSYGLLTYVGLPTGGSISYTWTTINFSSCDPVNVTKLSRAVASRTLNDGQGHSSVWTYSWGAFANGSQTNVVTDPAGNDTAHVFTILNPTGGSNPACNLYETSTIQYQGAASANHPLQRTDTTYLSAAILQDANVSNLANVFATDIVTTVYPSGKVKKVHKDSDSGPGAGKPIFGNVKKEFEYDWGQGQAGALLRETDTTYQWETNSAYLTAHLLDLPASVIVYDGAHNKVAETDYVYDEPAYLTTSGVTTQHATPPAGVRGNQTTVSRWLNTTNSFISSHTNWYDTGEAYQTIDPLGHATTHSYDPAYVGAYATQTCSPQTGSVTHCVSGTYDFNTGVLTSLTNENATTQASGNTPGDSDHTSNYSYDSMFRITSAQAPPDPANSSARAQTGFSFSAPNTFPVSATRTKSITNALSDSATSFFDGLGRGYKSQHVLPDGTASVDTTFDIVGHAATVSNPYFTTADPTYGLTQNAYDALDRVTQTTKQDGSISSVKYNVAVSAPGNCTDSTDEAGRQRRACADGLGRLVEVDEPNPGAAATYAQATITINGSEQANPLPALGGSGSVIISGAEGTSQVCSDPEPPAQPVCHNVPDSGTIGLKVGTYPANYVTYGNGSTGATLASALQQAFHNDGSSPVDAAIDPANNTKINFTARGTGVATNYALTYYNGEDFTFSGLTALSGGRDASSSPDTGTVVISVNGTPYSTTYGGSDPSLDHAGIWRGLASKTENSMAIQYRANITGRHD